MQVLGEKGMLRCENIHTDSVTHFSANGPLASGVVPSFADRYALKSTFRDFRTFTLQIYLHATVQNRTKEMSPMCLRRFHLICV